MEATLKLFTTLKCFSPFHGTEIFSKSDISEQKRTLRNFITNNIRFLVTTINFTTAIKNLFLGMKANFQNIEVMF